MSIDPKLVQAAFLEAVECGDPASRVAVLDRHCAADPGLRERVEALLAAHDRPQELPAGPAVEQPTKQHQPAHRPGLVVAERYKLLEQIGEGGMGTVWVAEQTQPVRRRVALKLIKPGMDSRQVLSRFEAERQALALMDHPNIAKVLDGGVTAEGRPFFVMEYVKGVPITDYCDEARLPISERLNLFVPVCQAVQHAHQKGIIHRDLKPSNILVCLYDGRPVPKIIDFGLAKAMHQPLTEHTLYTAHGLMVGTPLYMSPEQAEFNNLDIDTRSDIYSLGVVLYELLTGTTPLEKRQFKEAAWQEMLRLIKEQEPPRPSARLSGSGSLPSLAAQRQLEPARLPRLVRGELDWIVMKALEKERSRRYETANGLARDLERYMSDEPVQACPPSTAYRFRKFARRNKFAMAVVAAAVMILLLVIAGLTVSNRLIVAERNATAKALEEKEDALTVATAERKRAEESFLRASVAIRDVLTKAAMGAGEWAQLPPPLRKLFSDEVVKFYRDLIRQNSDDTNLQYETAVGYRSLGTLHVTSGEPDKAVALFEQSIAILKRLSAEQPATLPYRHQFAWSNYNLGRTFFASKRLSDAQGAFQIAADLYEDLLREAPDSSDYRGELAHCCSSLAQVYQQRGDTKRAIDFLARELTLLNRLANETPDDLTFQDRLAKSSYFLGYVQATGGKPADAKASFEKGAAIYRKTYEAGATVPRLFALLDCYMQIVALPTEDPQLMESEQAYRQYLQIESDAPRTLLTNAAIRKQSGHVRRIWAFKLWAADRLKESEQVFREALAIFEKLTTDPNHDGESLHLAADTLRLIAELELRRGDSKQAEASLRKAIDLHEGRATDFADLKVARHDQAFPYLQLALLLVQSGQPQEARSLTDRALDIDPANHWLWYLGARLYLAAGDVENYRRACGEMLDRFGQPAEAQPEIAERTAKTCALAPGAVPEFSRVEKLADRAVAGTQQHGYYRNFLLAKGLVEYRAGRHAEAIEWLARFAPKADGQHWDATGSSALAMAHHGLGHADEARAALTAAQAIIDQKMPVAANGHPVLTFDFDWLDAQILYQEAERLLKEKDES